jgi:hypothetical protein
VLGGCTNFFWRFGSDTYLSSIGARIAQRYSVGLQDGSSGIRVPAEAGNFSPYHRSRQVLGPTQTPVQWAPGNVSLRTGWPGREADHSPPSSAEVKECVGLCLHSPNASSWRGACLGTGTALHLPFTYAFI